MATVSIKNLVFQPVAEKNGGHVITIPRKLKNENSQKNLGISVQYIENISNQRICMQKDAYFDMSNHCNTFDYELLFLSSFRCSFE